MKATFESDDPFEIERIVKSQDMAWFIFELESLMKDKNEIKTEDVYKLLRAWEINTDSLIE